MQMFFFRAVDKNITDSKYHTVDIPAYGKDCASFMKRYSYNYSKEQNNGYT